MAARSILIKRQISTLPHLSQRFKQTAISAIDTSGIEAVFELRRRLEKQSLQLVLVNPVGSVLEKLHKSKIIESLGLSGLYLTVDEAVTDLSSTWKAQGQP